MNQSEFRKYIDRLKASGYSVRRDITGSDPDLITPQGYREEVRGRRLSSTGSQTVRNERGSVAADGGLVVGPALLTLIRVRDERARGFAIGMTSHGIGTSRVLGESTTAGGWSSAAMVLNALAMTFVLPLVAQLVTA